MSNGIISEETDRAKREGLAVDALSVSEFFGNDICAPGWVWVEEWGRGGGRALSAVQACDGA